MLSLLLALNLNAYPVTPVIDQLGVKEHRGSCNPNTIKCDDEEYTPPDNDGPDTTNGSGTRTRKTPPKLGKPKKTE